MKAIRVDRIGGREALTYTDVPDPTPKHGQVLVAIEFAGVNFIDVYVRQGLYSLPMPFTLGMEAAGTVAQVGHGVSGFRFGDRVACRAMRKCPRTLTERQT